MDSTPPGGAQGAASPIRVVVADDSTMVRTGLRVWLEEQQDIVVVGEADGGHHALHQVKKLQPDVVLLDMRMPDLDGLAVIAQIKAEDWPTKVVAMTAHPERFFKRILAQGVAGYISKEADPEIVLRAVRWAAMGRSWYDPEELLHEMRRKEQVDQFHLTPTERQVLQWVEYSRKEIAERLEMSDGVVRTHLYNIYSKLGVKSQLEAIRVARKYGLLTHPPERRQPRL